MKKCPICKVSLKRVTDADLKNFYICDGKSDGPKHVFKLAFRSDNGKVTTVLKCYTPPEPNLGKMFSVNVTKLPN